MFKNKKEISLTDKKLELFLNGVKLEYDLSDDTYKIYNKTNVFIGIGEVKNKKLKRDVVM